MNPMKKLFLVFLFCIIALAISPVLYAQEIQQKPSVAPDYKNYLVIKGGVFDPQGNLSSFSTGFNGELAYGYRFHRNAALEFSEGYLGVVTNTIQQSGSGFSLRESKNVYAFPLTVAIKGIVPINKQFDLYALGGTGAYFVKGNAAASVTIQNIGSSRVTFSDITTVWGGFLGAGVTYNITPQVFVGLEGKYLWATSATLRNTVEGVLVSADFKIQGLQGTANLGFRF